MRRSLLLLLGVVFVGGCDVLIDLFLPGIIQEETGSSELKRFESQQELADYLTSQITARNSDLAPFPDRDSPLLDPGDDFDGVVADGAAASGDLQSTPTAAPGESLGTVSDSGGRFSETTTQEVGVDEADVVKTDGTYVYVLDGSSLRIIQVVPPDALAVVGEVSVQGFGRELYLHDDKVIALTSLSGGFFYGGGIGVLEPIAIEGRPVAFQTQDGDAAVSDGGAIADGVEGSDSLIASPDVEIATFTRPRTIVTVIDVSDPTAPNIIETSTFDGSQSSSRMINGVLHLVLANFQTYYFDVLPLLGRETLDLTAIDVEELLPGYEQTTIDGTAREGALLTWQELYRPTDPDGFGVVTVVSVNVANGSDFSAVGVVTEPGMIYSSPNALYLTDTNYDFSGNTRETTDIYKLAYVDGGTEPVATGTVPGRVLNQYSMGEHAGNLRVATTVSAAFLGFGQRSEPSNHVYVLSQAGQSLTIVGRLEDIAPGETIQSARFVGDRGFVVTFEVIDPLFTLDLSDPTDPRIVGELKVPGFSTFMVPIDEDHLLAVGQYIPEGGFFFSRGVQLSIFDVSDFSNPKLAHQVVLGDGGGAYSEALHNPKAFTYFAQAGLVALPISLFDEIIFFDDVIAVDAEPIDVIEPFVPRGFDGLVVYSVSVDNGFTALGRISTRFEDAGYFYGGSFTRGVFIDENVFAVTNFGIRGAPTSDIAAAPFELLMAPPFVFDDFVIVSDGSVPAGVEEGSTGSNGESVVNDMVP